MAGLPIKVLNMQTLFIQYLGRFDTVLKDEVVSFLLAWTGCSLSALPKRMDSFQGFTLMGVKMFLHFQETQAHVNVYVPRVRVCHTEDTGSCYVREHSLFCLPEQVVSRDALCAMSVFKAS